MNTAHWFIAIRFLTVLVHSDLPIHATLSEIVGRWDFRLLPTSKSGSAAEHSLIHNALLTCGSGLPNRNSDNIGLGRHDYLEAIQGQLKGLGFRPNPIFDLSVDLTAKRGSWPDLFSPEKRRNWKPLQVLGSTDRTRIGYWTMIYDEGFEIELPEKGLSLVALLNYRLLEEKPECVKQDEADEESYQCYQTRPSETIMGWFSYEVGDGDRIAGCFSGKKQNHRLTHGSGRDEILRAKHGRRHKAPFEPVHSIATNVNASATDSLDSNNLWLDRFGILHRSPNSLSPGPPCRKSKESESALEEPPLEASWGDPWLRRDLMDAYDFAVPNQGACGGCYAIASAFAMTKRLGNQGSVFCPKAILECSFLNQGCEGGYPSLVGKWAQLQGVQQVSQQCEGLESPSKCPTARSLLNVELKVPGEMVKWDVDSIHPISASGYVGGCYGCATEKDIMREIAYNGPVVAAIHAPSSLEFYKDGVFSDSPELPHRSCSQVDMEAGINGWEFTVCLQCQNHAASRTTQWLWWAMVVRANTVTGLLEIPGDPSGGKVRLRVQILPSLVVEGYFKVRRGVDLGGIENQVVFFDLKQTKRQRKAEVFEPQPLHI